MIRFLTAGESHGKGVVVIIEGMPANVPISLPMLQNEMQKRKKGAGSGGRQLLEDDAVEVLSGIRFGKTLGSPITIYVENKDFKNWGQKMSVVPQDEVFIDGIKVIKPRPGHADLAGVLKYGFDDVRNVLERASARETTARVAAGAIFKQFLANFNIDFASHTIQIGNIRLSKQSDFTFPSSPQNNLYTFEDIKNVYHNDPEIRCVDTNTSAQMKTLIQKARMDMNTLGGIVEAWAVGVPVGLGSYVHFDQKIDSQIAQAIMSIPSVKAVEIGQGVLGAASEGSEVHDEIYYKNKDETSSGFYRQTNRAGGVEGGITNGMPIVVRAYHKPISTLYRPLKTVNIKTKKPDQATVERSDICVVPRAGVISECMLAYVIVQNFVKKFGTDNLDDIKNNYNSYKERLAL